MARYAMTATNISQEHTVPQIYVSLDLETTGVNPERDTILEIGAVRFQGREILGKFSTLVNPYVSIPSFVQYLTGIRQQDVDHAPPFDVAAADLVAFVGETPVVGHSVGFDTAFLASHGVRFEQDTFDTWELASILLPNADYSLISLARSFGATHVRPHRALSDAEATHVVFIELLERAMELDPAILEELARLTSAADMPICHLFRSLGASNVGWNVRSALGIGGVDLEGLEQRLARKRRISRPLVPHANLPVEKLVSAIRDGGALSRALPSFEYRSEQEKMLRSVARSFEENTELLVEAGTGTGKSMAYLLPAALFALTNNVRVVVSTNTINLQEQLIQKDLPAVEHVLREEFGVAGQDFRYSALKGRSNYLCLRRWGHFRSNEFLSDDEARLLGKVAIWLGSTATGDRGELSLFLRDNLVWSRLSAQGARECPYSTGVCFLRAARERAESAHVVVVNHALLLSDAALGGGLIPDYDYLIIDEAHHLEDEATRQFGFSVGHDALDEELNALGDPRGLAAEAVAVYRASNAAKSRRQLTEKAVLEFQESVARARGKVEKLFDALVGFIREHSGNGTDGREPFRATDGVRTQPGWSALELSCEDADLALDNVVRNLGSVYSSLDGLEEAGLLNYEALRAELTSRAETLEEVRQRLRQFFVKPQSSTVYWIGQSGSGGLILYAAPLRVDEVLRDTVFRDKHSVVFTSATLSAGGSFEHIRGQLGLDDADELSLGSPFNFRRAALVCIPEDMPEPSHPDYTSALARTIGEVALALGGYTMALFTSHSSLRAVAASLRTLLASGDLRVLAQGVDGSPRQLLRGFNDDPRGILLGTSSLWEGVDISGEKLKALVLTRLPFNVPTDPIFSARSELFEDPFREYSIPQAVLRFRQGFGRLIRKRSDRGAVVILDRRIASRSYGDVFLRSLPTCTVERPVLSGLPKLVTDWALP